ncbi:hypothetical protein JCM21900_005296 [Sporobolomyces salmonicolor]
MECAACNRSDSNRPFYCQNCISTRLGEHYSRRQQLRNALTLVTGRGSALLGGEGSGGKAGQLGVRQESELKADKWRLAIRLRDARLATEKGKEEVDTAIATLQARRSSLAARRANLSTARSLLSTLSSSSDSPTSLAPSAASSLPSSIPSLQSHLVNLQTTLHDLSLESARVRRILALELLAVYALQPVEAPLADPFLPLPQTSNLRAPYSSPSSSSPLDPSPPTPFPPSYTLAALPLPPLSALLTLRQPHLEAILLHLVHLTRLLALYEGVRLPFAPMPSCFGPGRPGLRATPGWGLAGGEDGKEAKRKGLSQDCWPICFGSKKASRAAEEGGEEEANENEAPEKARSRSGAEGNSRKDTKRTMAVLVGAVALAFDLAYIAWIREGRTAEHRAVPRAISDEELDDLGALILRAAGVESQDLPPARRSSPSPCPSSSIATLTPAPSAFPIDFACVVRRYTTFALSPPGKKSRSTLGDSAGSFIDADEAEEEWDFV